MRQPLAVLKEYWGYPDFRPMQLDIIQSVLSSRDTLALLPTGGGKSICFQVPALCQEGVCVVISPLIALMKDQVAQLQKRGIAAEAIYAGMSYRDIDRKLDNCVHGSVRFLYLSPERLTTDLTRARIKRMNVSLFAIDEAHCISQWGYDFRPPYLRIAEIRQLHPEVPVIALTATATEEVVADIQKRLEFKDSAQVFQKSFERSNLHYVVRHTENKLQQLGHILKNVPGSAVVYARNRRQTQDVARWLQRREIAADFYHAGLHGEERSLKQDAWINDQSRVMVATNAFGMGIDKPDVRVVVHLSLPDNLEAYFQEAGRAGRDGKKAYAVLLYHPSERKELSRQFKLAYPPLPFVRNVYRALGSFLQIATGGGLEESFDFDLAKFCANYDFKPLETLNALKLLEREGWISLSEAVYRAPTLQVKVDKQGLYDYTLRNRKMERLLQVLLRSQQGIFNHPVQIRQQRLSQALRMPMADLERGLQKLAKDEIVIYTPAKDKPQISFTQERIPAKDLIIDKARYDFLRERHLYRLKAAVYYAEQPICRSQQLLAYFNETDAPPCGRCDICLAKKQTQLDAQSFDELRPKIEQALQKPTTLKDFLAQFPRRQEQALLKALEYLQDEEQVALSPSGELSWLG